MIVLRPLVRLVGVLWLLALALVGLGSRCTASTDS